MKKPLLLILFIIGIFAFIACDEATTTAAPTTAAPTTAASTTAVPTTAAPTTVVSTTTVSGEATTTAVTTEATTEPATTTETTTAALPLPTEFSDVVADSHVYLTTVGQTADMDIVYNIITNVYGADVEGLAEDVTMNALLMASAVPTGSVVIIVPGASSKGMGAAGTNLTAEQARANAFAARAEAGEITLFVIHNGGSQRRGVESDPLITASAAQASLMLVIESANYDGFFDTLSATYDLPTYLYVSVTLLVPPLRQIFGKLA